MTQSSGKFRVITVHGVNTRGEWQEEVARALQMFFDFEPIKYDDYRRLWGSELVLCPIAWIPMAVAFILLLALGILHGAVAITLSIILILLLSVLATFPYRHRAIQSFRKKLSAKYETGGAPPRSSRTVLEPT